MALQERQRRLYCQRISVWRQFETMSATGDVTRTWPKINSGVPCYIEVKPSNFGLVTPGVFTEGDNLFTLDELHVEAGTDIQTDDILRVDSVTQGTGAGMVGEYFTVRGDMAPHGRRSNHQNHIIKRLALPPSGVS